MRMSTHGVNAAPQAAPSRLMPYSRPIVLPAVRTSATIPRTSSGSDVPMRNVGRNRPRKCRMPARQAGVYSHEAFRYSRS